MFYSLTKRTSFMSRYKIKRKIRKGRVCGCLQYSHLIDVFNGMKRDNDFCSNNHLAFDQSNLHITFYCCLRKVPNNSLKILSKKGNLSVKTNVVKSSVKSNEGVQ